MADAVVEVAVGRWSTDAVWVRVPAAGVAAKVLARAVADHLGLSPAKGSLLPATLAGEPLPARAWCAPGSACRMLRIAPPPPGRGGTSASSNSAPPPAAADRSSRPPLHAWATAAAGAHAVWCVEDCVGAVVPGGEAAAAVLPPGSPRVVAELAAAAAAVAAAVDASPASASDPVPQVLVLHTPSPLAAAVAAGGLPPGAAAALPHVALAASVLWRVAASAGPRLRVELCGAGGRVAQLVAAVVAARKRGKRRAPPAARPRTLLRACPSRGCGPGEHVRHVPPRQRCCLAAPAPPRGPRDVAARVCDAGARGGAPRSGGVCGGAGDDAV